MTVGHFMQIYQNTGVAMVETDTLREEHRRIAMCIKNKDALMQLLRLIKLGSLSSKPLEYLQSVFLQPFRMPLHTEIDLYSLLSTASMMPSVDLAMQRSLFPGTLTA